MMVFKRLFSGEATVKEDQTQDRSGEQWTTTQTVRIQAHLHLMLLYTKSPILYVVQII